MWLMVGSMSDTLEERASKKSGVRLVKERWDYFAIGKPSAIAAQADRPEVSWFRSERNRQRLVGHRSIRPIL